MIYLVRHGQDLDNKKGILNGWRDMPLTPEGKNQAFKVARELKGYGINKIFSTTLIRGYVTARIIADELDICTITSDRSLRERNFGHLTGDLISNVQNYSGEIMTVDENNFYFLSGAGVESFPKLTERLMPFYKSLSRWKKSNVVVVSHGDVMKMLLAIHHRVDFREMLKTKHFKNCEIVPLD